MADRNNIQDTLHLETYVNMSESVPDDFFEIGRSENVSDINQSIDLSKSGAVGSLDFIDSTDHSLLPDSTNAPGSSISLVSDELNKFIPINDEPSDTNINVSDECNDYTIIDEYENHAAENVDDDCYVVASFTPTTPAQDKTHISDSSKSIASVVEYVDLTQDEPEETKFQDSFVHEFTKDTRLCILLDVIPDANPEFLKQQVDEFKTDEELQLFVLDALERRTYPKVGEDWNSLAKKTDKGVQESDFIQNGDVSRSNIKSVNPSSSQQSNNINTSYLADLNHLVRSETEQSTAIRDQRQTRAEQMNDSYLADLNRLKRSETEQSENIRDQRQNRAEQYNASYLADSSSLVRPETEQSNTINTSYPADLNHLVRSEGEKNREGPPTLTISATVTPKMFPSQTRATSLTNPPYPIVSIPHYAYQRPRTKITIIGAKPHTVTSQEAYNRTSSNIPQTVTSSSHTEVRFPGFSVQDKTSQQGIKRLETLPLTYIPNHSIVSPTQAGDSDGPLNLTVNLPAQPVINLPAAGHQPRIIGPPATYIDAPRAPRQVVRREFIQNAHFWVPLAINIFNETETIQQMRDRRRRIGHEIRRHRHGRRNRAWGTRFEDLPPQTPRAWGTQMEELVQALGSPTVSPNEVENERLKLLSGILTWADPEFLKNEANKLNNDDDVEKFLIRAIANEELWNKCVTGENQTQKILTDNKYKILLELLPDANPTFLKRESANLRNDEEVHEFAMKLGREQNYPKRKSPSSSSKTKSNKRKHSEMSDPEPTDSKYQTLLDMLPDADPDFLLQESKVLGDSDDLQKFVLKAVENKTYPKRDQFLERQEYHKQWKKYIENFNIKEFLKVIPNPVKYFYIDKVNSKNPLNMPGNFLQHRYRRKCNHHFGHFFTAAKQNLTKTCDILDVRFQTKPRKYGVWDQKTIFSTSILQEIAFIQNKKEIAHYLLFKEELKLEAYEKAKTEGTLQECSCCYDDKLPEDMTSCLVGHKYCLNCIKRGSEVVIGNGGTKFPCYSEGCKEEFSFDILQTVLNPEVFSRLLIRKQYEEVNAAGIPGLETCSFCEFCSIPPAEDKLFRCLNPSCMKVTCRSCKKLDHLPLSCEEFAQKETRQKMQTYVEDKMTEALVRTCWQCGTKFVKENGCNMMQCKCGAKMCYFCRQPVQDYHHFVGGRCAQFLDTTAHDEAAVIDVGKKAKQEIEAANPGYSLQNDPTESLLLQQPKHNTYYFGHM